MRDWRKTLIRPDATLHDALAAIEDGATGIALVVDAENRLLGTVTDGDVRRAILRGVPLDGSVQLLLLRPKGSPYSTPVVAPTETPDDELVALMHIRAVGQIPLVDPRNRVVGLVTLAELTRRRDLGIPAVVMVGGLGTRLSPLTDNTPKSLLPVGQKPILEHIIEGLCRHGIYDIWMATHHRSEQIRNHLGDGQQWGVRIQYIHEVTPLGTAGALSLLPEPFHTPFLLMNGDLLTRLNYRSLLRFHQDIDADMTVCIKEFDIQVPYGVVEVENGLVWSLREKPANRFLINAGIYILSPHLLDRIPQGQQFNITDLVHSLTADGRRVAAYPIREYWLDIGQMPDYEKAQLDAADGRLED